MENKIKKWQKCFITISYLNSLGKLWLCQVAWIVFFTATLTFLCPVQAAKKASDISLGYAWEYRLQGFSQKDYRTAVEALVADFERLEGVVLRPGATGRVGLKVDTFSGGVFATPLALTRAVIAFLESRGFEPKNIFILDQSTELLRRAGYLPPLSAASEPLFEGVHPVYALDTGKYYGTEWFYESPLPSESRWFPLAFDWRQTLISINEERKSFLPMPLMFGVDFWINLPVVRDDTTLGVRGALANASLGAVSNVRRFTGKATNAPIAVAEIAAIPELRKPWIFTLMSLEKYQFVGGPIYNALYTKVEPRIWLSANPVVLDYVMFQKINRARVHAHFSRIEPVPTVFDYSEILGLGDYGNVRWMRSGQHSRTSANEVTNTLVKSE
jgi:hypothetical protein